MKTEDFINVEVKNQYGEVLTIIEINDNVATVAAGMDNMYHISKIFYKGKSVQEWLNKNEF